MKKIISLVLALAFIGAVAVSASAITGSIYPAVSKAKVAPYTDFDLRLVTGSSVVGATNLDILNLVNIPANQAFVQDSVVYFAFTFTAQKEGSDKGDITMHSNDYLEPGFLLSSDVLDFAKSSFKMFRIGQYYTVTTESFDAERQGSDKRWLIYNIPTPDSMHVREYVFVAPAC